MTEKLKFCVSQKSWGQEYDWPGRGDCSWAQSLHKHWVNGRKKCMLCEQKEGEKKRQMGGSKGRQRPFRCWMDGRMGGEIQLGVRWANSLENRRTE